MDLSRKIKEKLVDQDKGTKNGFKSQHQRLLLFIYCSGFYLTFLTVLTSLVIKKIELISSVAFASSSDYVQGKHLQEFSSGLK